MGLIRVLPSSLVNRIAAGECVERPSSVVKELMENSLDAGASRVDVSILDGGRGLIQVADDGVGMEPDDLALSVAQHATSKISTDDDLFNIHTMGFRGEALASIGAVSRMRITSRRNDSLVGHNIRVEAGQLAGPSPCTAPAGTTVEVHDLFYCVPVRRKFLRTTPTEMGHITEQFARIALAHPGVAFTLHHHNRELHSLAPTADRRQRIADFYGPELAGVLLPVRREGGGVLVEGCVAPPAQCRRSTKWEYVFVNGRYVRDRFISHATREAYRSLIGPEECPVVFLFLTVDPAMVDVNVHPTKIEVRWRDSNYIHAQVLAALREKFLSTNLDRPFQPPTPDDEAYRQRVRSAMVDFFTRAQAGPGSQGTVGRGPGAGGPRGQAVEAARGQGAEGPRGQGVEPGGYQPASETGQPVGRSETAGDSQVGHPFSLVGETAPLAPTRAIQIHNTYLVAQTGDGLMIIDQHALHERILYEELRQRLTERPLESQRLLIPEVINVAPDRIGVLETHADTLQRLGIELASTGPRTLALHAFPPLLERANPTTFVADLLDLLSEHGQRPNTESLVHELMDMMACKAAVKAGDPLTADEIAALLARRDLAERSSHCPHGRPSTLQLSLRDLERQFRRR